MKILALDVSSSCTGWVLLEGEKGNTPELLKTGSIKSVGSILGFGGHTYPWDYYWGIRDRVEKIGRLVREVSNSNKLDAIVVEETNAGGRAGRYSQKVLEQIHFALWEELTEMQHSVPLHYVNTSSWRRNLGQSMSKADKALNANVRKFKKNGDKAALRLLGVLGKIGKKHLSVRWVNETFGLQLKLKDNDVCDAISLGCAYLNGVPTCNGK